MELKKVTVSHFRKMKEDSEKIVCLTAYDYTSAKILDEAGVDLILVGDSLGMVVNGQENTLQVTLDELIYHTKSVKRGIKRGFLVADMPFGSYHVSEEETLKNAIRVIKESGAEAVKLEGGKEIAPLVKKLTLAGINVIGHVGLMPQKVLSQGGYKIQGRDNSEKLIEDAVAIEDAGAFAIVLEGVLRDVAKKISKQLKIPTIGIGAGEYCDGQILVFHDVFGLFDDLTPKFVKRYANLREQILEAAKRYSTDVRNGTFPQEIHSFLR